MCVRVIVNGGLCATECGYDWGGESGDTLLFTVSYTDCFADNSPWTCHSRRWHQGKGKDTSTSLTSDRFYSSIIMKVLGAHRAGITTVILPWANRKDVKHDVPEEIRKSMTFVFAKTVREALESAFGKGTLGWRGEEEPMMESRL